MKIIYDSQILKSFKAFNEFYYISTNYNKIKKTGKIGNKNIFWNFVLMLILFSGVLLLFFDLIFIKGKVTVITVLYFILLIIMFFTYLFALVGFLLQYYSVKKYLGDKKKKNKLFIDENGIRDEETNTCMLSKWKDLSNVIVGKYLVFIYTVDGKCYYYPISIKEKIIKAIDQYSSNKKITLIEKDDA